jgi:hypothetical protein
MLNTPVRHHDEGHPMSATTISIKTQAIRWVFVSSIAAGLTALGLGIASANPPVQDHPCSLRHAAMRDGDGHLMRCDRMQNGNHGLVWQYTPGS